MGRVRSSTGTIAVLAAAALMMAGQAQAAPTKLIAESSNESTTSPSTYVVATLNRPLSFRLEVGSTRALPVNEYSDIGISCTQGTKSRDTEIPLGGKVPPFSVRFDPLFRRPDYCIVSAGATLDNNFEDVSGTISMLLYGRKQPKPKKHR